VEELVSQTILCCPTARTRLFGADVTEPKEEKPDVCLDVMS